MILRRSRERSWVVRKNDPRPGRRLRSASEPQDADGRGAPARRRAGQGIGALPGRREQPRVSRVLRPTRGAPDHRWPADERAARLHQHALQAALRLRAARGRCRVGHASHASHGDRGDLQRGPPADAGPAPGAVRALPSDRRGVRLPEPRVRGLGGRRRHRDHRDPRGRGGHQDVRRLDRPGRVPTLQRERLADDDSARRRRSQRLHAGARGAPVRRPARPGAGLHRSQGRHLGQHPGDPRHRRQDGGAADCAVRVARGGDRPRGRALACARTGGPRARRTGPRLEAPRDDAPRPPARGRPLRARLRVSRPLDTERDLPALRVPRAAREGRHARRGAACGIAARDGCDRRSVAGGDHRRVSGADRARACGRSRRRRGGGGGRPLQCSSG